tara:strand:+ start:268 stop:444 length:177 start_codon:yes stop_codon:yes gene_type:complete
MVEIIKILFEKFKLSKTLTLLTALIAKKFTLKINKYTNMGKAKKLFIKIKKIIFEVIL